MKAIVERTIVGDFFPQVIKTITLVKDEKELRDKFDESFIKIALIWGLKIGFGGSHMWVSKADTDERLLLVPFN
jgi:hypothetical protein